MKAHDVFPAVCYPDYFWQQARDNIEGDWYLMCPHEISTVKGYALDCYGEEWTRKYLECVADARIKARHPHQGRRAPHHQRAPWRRARRSLSTATR